MSSTQEWVDAVSRELGLKTPVDVEALLDLARVAAHQIERPAAPLTTYLLGYAVGQGLDPQVATAQITQLARNWAPDGPESVGPGQN